MVLVTEDHTLLQGAAEAVGVERPLITSDWPLLRAYFHKGSVFTANDPASIAEAVRTAMRRGADLAAEMHELKWELNRNWQQRVRELQMRLHTDEGPSRAAIAAINDNGGAV